MMKEYVLHIAAGRRPEPLQWAIDWDARGISVMPADTLKLVSAFQKTYPILLCLIELATADEQDERFVREVRELFDESERPVPLIGLTRGEQVLNGQRTRLAQAGLNHLVAVDEPPAFICWHLDLLLQLQRLSSFETSRMDVGELARTTREQLHDLSQPLSAIQGRLQLMASQAAEDDPNARTYNDMVELVLQVTRKVGEMQKTHRDLS